MSKNRIVCTAARFFAIGVVVQGLVAFSVIPFVKRGSPLYNGGITGVVAKTNESWLIRHYTTLTLLELSPPPVQVYGFPPDFEFLSNMRVGYLLDAQYGGPALARYEYQVISQVPRWSVISRRGDLKKAIKTRSFRTIERVTGWPLPSMYGRVRYRLSDEADPVHGFTWESPRYEWAIPIHDLHTTRNGAPIPVVDIPFIPLRPILLGIVANSAFYGLFFASIWLVFRRIWRLLTGAKKRERFKRGECFRCGYPLGDLGRCPECGTQRKFKKQKEEVPG